MPEIVTGFFGKLPCRGDFVRMALPASFTGPWDTWFSSVLAASRDTLGDGWTPAWMEAPVWRFALPAGQCGPEAAQGLWMPSVDAAGRHFPLTIAAVPAGRDDAWLDAAEQCGRDALGTGTDPAQLAACLPDCPAGAAAVRATWWTAGAPRVPAVAWALDELPDPARFTAMLAGPG